MGVEAERDFVGHMTWDEVAHRIDAGAAAILPIGAGAKQHGLHMSLGTDRIQAEFLSSRLAARIDALVWPALTYGHYPAFIEYAGSTSLSAATFEAMVAEIASEILRHGCRALLVLDTGISTRDSVDRALARLAARNTLHLGIHEGPRYRHAAAALARQGHGSHADELETSLMLAIAPEIVDMPRAEASPAIAQAVPGRLTPSDRTSPNYSRSGSFGDPTLATLEKGEALLAAMLDDLVEQTTSFLAKLSDTAGRARGAAS
ncbi:creatininase family protein [Bradyrhizobium sp.]|uniref:creatininase family protein n=1 Tax=Bradyrhizobium sp. TaxID=376 RepID=UPI001D70C031|nr:creatininase family protein [Bradyrhizobium sp.]MBI5322336.1 creatininase family protein [Bradyrhizobium sp.]